MLQNKRHQTILILCECALMVALAVILDLALRFVQWPNGGSVSACAIPIIFLSYRRGWKWGLVVGFIAPLFRSLTLGMPPLYPTAFCMAFELATYGFVSGMVFMIFKNKNINIFISVIVSLIIAMLLGRVVWGIVRYVLALFDGSLVFNFQMFLSGAFITACPGIILQLLLIPTLIITLYKTNIIK